MEDIAISKVWGEYTVLYDKYDAKVKELVVKPNTSTSLQKHFKRMEIWFLVKGELYVEIEGDFSNIIKPGDSVYIQKGLMHRFTNIGEVDAVFIEIQYGACFEDDIQRFAKSVEEVL